MMLEIPQYEGLNFKMPVIGVGNFSTTEPVRKEQDDLYEPGFDCQIKRDIIRDKFRLWKTVQSFGMPEDPKERAKIQHLLTDKSIFAYAYFRLHGKPVEMRYYQDVILSDTYDRILFIGSNQIGKSVSLDVDAADEFLRDHGKEWRGLLVSNSLVQSKERMSSIRHLLASSPFDIKSEDTTENKTGKQVSMTIISYTFYDEQGRPKYTNKLICCPHTSAALGYPCDVLWLDEIEFWENVKGGIIHWLYQVAIPRTFETQGKIKAYSNPVQGGVMQALMKLRDKNGVPVWHTYRFNYWDRLDATQEDFDRKSFGMTQAEVSSTLLGDFARAEGAFLTKEEIEDQYSPELQQMGDNAGLGKETYWFLDIGEVHDQCCLVGGFPSLNPDPKAQEHGLPLINTFWIHKYPVGYPLARVIGAESDFSKDDGWEEYAAENPSVLQVLRDHAEFVGDTEYLPVFGCDVTNNAAAIPLCQSVGIDPVPIKFTGPQKWHMYQRYQIYSQQRWFKRCNDRDDNAIMSPDGILSDFPYQASKLRVKKRSETNTRYGQIHHENENDLDDTQDAGVGMIYLIECPDYSSGTFDVLSPEGVSVVDPDTGEVRSDEALAEQDKILKEKYDSLEDQYIPGFVDRKELGNWMEDRELR